MKHLKLFFALFAMLALGVTNAWGAENVTITKTTNTLVSELGWSVSSGSTCAGCYTEFQLDEAITISTTGTPNCGSIWGTTTNDWRLYQTQNGNVIVSAKEGYELVSIKLTYSPNKNGTLKDGSTTINSNAVVSCSGLKTKTLTVGNTSTNTNGQVRITTFSVTYVQTAGSGSSPVTPAQLPAPTGLTVDDITSSGATLSWNAVANASNYSVTINGNNATATTNSYNATGLTAGTEYTWSVVAKGDGTNYTDSDAAQHTFTTTAATTPDPEPGTGTSVTYDFTKIEGFQDWPTSYASGKGDVVYTEATVKFTGAVKQTSTITDCPVTKGGEVQLVLNSGYSDRDITNVTFVCKKWGSKAQTITLHYSTDGGVNYTNTNITSTNFTISSDNLPEGTNAVKITFSSTSNQVGIASVTFSLSSDDEPGTEEPVVSVTDEQLKWSAATATALKGADNNEFPTLTNDLGLTVTYDSSNKDAATIAADGTITLVAPGTTTISAKFAGGEVSGTTYAAKTVSYTLTVKKAPLDPIAGGVIDILNQEWTGVSGTTYTDVAEKTAENTGHSNAKYVAQCAGDKSSIQLRSNNSNSGVVSTVSGGVVKRIEVEWHAETDAARTLQIYGSNTAYTAATDLYGDAKGELLGELNKGEGETTLDFSEWTGDYKYIGFRSKSGAMYLTTITITWLPINSKVTIDDAIQNGSISVRGAADLNAVAAGTVLTLDNTPEAGYKFVKYNVYKTDEPTTEINVENSFTMPEYDVTVSATFTSIKELDRIEVNTTNVKTTFWQGETFNSTGLVVTAYYTDETSTIVTPKSIIGSTAEAGTKQVTVSYTEGEITKETKYDITVKAIANNEETPYTVIEAREIIDAVGNTTVEVYVQGIVSKIVTAFNPNYGNISYDISADGLKTSDQLQAFRGFSYDGAWFTSADDIQVGDVVVVKGKLKIYNTTYELDEGNKLVSLVRSTEPKPTAATLPFEFDGNKDDIADVVGMSYEGLGNYSTSPKLKFDDANDNVIIHFDSEPGEFSFALKQNGQNAGTFTVYESENGEDYTSVWSGGNLGNGQTSTIESNLSSTARYVKFELTEKGSSTNYGLGQISIKKIDKRQDAGIAWNLATVSLTVGDAFTPPTFSKPNSVSVTDIEFTSSNPELATVTNAGEISLVSGKTGTATITATFAGDATYKAAEVTCTIIVNHKSEDVVILAKCKDQYYAMVAEYVEGKTDVLQALPVEYVNGKIYNIETEEQKASIIWKRIVVDGKTTFKNGDNYLSAVNSAALKLATETCDWVFEGDMYKIEGSTRTILYYTSTGGFKNYATTNMSNDGVNGEYSSAAITVAPVFADGDAYHRTTTPNKFGTICLPFGSNNYTGAEFYELVQAKADGVVLASVTTLVAGTPYIFLASATEVAVYGDGTTAATPGNSNGLYGTFTDNTEVAVGNYILKDNALCQAEAICYVNAYRAYIVMSEVPTEPVQQMPGRRYIGMSVQGENEATGFENITAPAGKTVKAIVNGQLIIIRDGEMYNAQGVRL